VRVFAFNPDAAEGVESYRLGWLNKEISPGVNLQKLSHRELVLLQGLSKNFD
jgi:hypothetical protein